jgi:beta-RFAP synthase
LVARLEVPPQWRVVLVLPPWGKGLHGPPEALAFQRLASGRAERERTDTLSRLVLLGMLPALAEGDLEGFGEAVHDFNRRVGEAFGPQQGGTYADARVAELVTFLRQQGIRGVGQSSWGPTVFALVASQTEAEALVHRLQTRFCLSGAEAFAVSPCNTGAQGD